MHDKAEQTLEALANKIVALGWQAPATFFLEAHKPLNTIFHTGTLMLAPIAAPLFGAERIQNLQVILADPENVERLIKLIEEYSNSSEVKASV